MKPAENEFAAEVRRGAIVSTPGAIDRFEKKEMIDALKRHLKLDWRDMDPDDQAANLRAAMTGEGRVFGAFRIRVTPDQSPDLWIITEADRSVTTFLLPEEY